MFTGSDIPPGRTATFNVTTSFEPGVMVHIHQNKGISLGVRLWHLSNAGTGCTNPSFNAVNAVQVVVGDHWLKTGLLQQTLSAN